MLNVPVAILLGLGSALAAGADSSPPPVNQPRPQATQTTQTTQTAQTPANQTPANQNPARQSRGKGEAWNRQWQRIAALPENIRALAILLNRQPDLGREAFIQLATRCFGPPQRDVGSGVSIPVWELNGKLLKFMSFDDVPLLVRVSPATSALDISSVEFYAPNAQGSSCWLGNLDFSPDPGQLPAQAGHQVSGRYAFRFARSFPELEKQFANTFLARHPKGKFVASLATPINPDSMLEDLPANSTVANFAFIPDGAGESRRLSIPLTIRRSGAHWPNEFLEFDFPGFTGKATHAVPFSGTIAGGDPPADFPVPGVRPESNR